MSRLEPFVTWPVGRQPRNAIQYYCCLTRHCRSASRAESCVPGKPALNKTAIQVTIHAGGIPIITVPTRVFLIVAPRFLRLLRAPTIWPGRRECGRPAFDFRPFQPSSGPVSAYPFISAWPWWKWPFALRNRPAFPLPIEILRTILPCRRHCRLRRAGGSGPNSR